MKLRFQLVILVLFASVVLFAVYNISIVSQEIAEKQYNDLVHELSDITKNFDIWIIDKVNIVETTKDVIDNFTCEELVQWNKGNPYLNINNENPNVSQIYIGLTDGNFITGGQWVPPKEYDPRTRTWYKEAHAADKTIVSKVYIDRETGDKLVTVSSPLYLESKFVGVISADVFLDDINDFIITQLKDEDYYAYLVDDDGTIVIHTKNSDLCAYPVKTCTAPQTYAIL